ncbi:MAG: phosphoribosylglycinamide formyltransferase [Peptococcaceae bacterium]|nr:phosphoribosylglycinamide formyltransferase [Peptococcaceae bacterium]
MDNSDRKPKIGVLVSGRGSNLQALIDNLADLAVDISIVITDKPESLALKRAAKAGIPTVVVEAKSSSKTEFEQAILTTLQQSGVELVVLAGFMRLLSAEFLAQSPGPVLNIHPALLPAFPGLHAQAQALAYGVKVSGCTVHFVDAGMDSGPIIAQRTVPVLDADDEASLSARILAEEHVLLPEVVRLWATGRVIVTNKRVHIKGD